MSKAVSFFIGFLIATAISWVYFDRQGSINDQVYQSQVDSINKEKKKLSENITNLESKIEEKDSSISSLYDRIQNEKNKRIEFEKKAKEKKIEIDSLPLDSVAKIVTGYFGGGEHKIVRLSKNAYVCFRDTIVRNIAKGTIEMEKLKYGNISLHNEINKKDSVITQLRLIRMDQDLIADRLRHKLALEESKGEFMEDIIIDLRDKVKKYKIIGSAGVVVGILIAIL